MFLIIRSASRFVSKESRFPAPKKRKAAALDGIYYKEESRFPAPKKRKAAALDGIDYKEVELQGWSSFTRTVQANQIPRRRVRKDSNAYSAASSAKKYRSKPLVSKNIQC